MTPEQIEKLTIRELDAALAVHLFGWRWFQRREDKSCRWVMRPDTPEFPPFSPVGPLHAIDAEFRFEEEHIERWFCDLPKFAEDANAMLEVVERMRHLGWYAIVKQHPPYKTTAGFSRLITPDEAPIAVTTASTWPQAVCRAALLAVASMAGKEGGTPCP